MTGVSLDSIDALLFDLGGVVIDIDFADAIAYWAERSSQPEAGLTERFSFDEPYRLHEIGHIDVVQYFESLRHSLDLDLSDEDLLAGWNNIYLGVSPGIEAVLRAASQRWRLFAFSNSNDAHKRHWSVHYADVLSAFETVFVSSDIGARKPSPAAFETVATRIGTTVDRILFFDDTMENITGAAAVGMPAVHVSSTADIRRALDLPL